LKARPIKNKIATDNIQIVVYTNRKYIAVHKYDCTVTTECGAEVSCVKIEVRDETRIEFALYC